MAYRILALSGGGFLGYYTISVLVRLEAMAGEPLARRFDLLAGTSIGGIIALALARGIPAAAILERFETDGAAIFSPRHPPRTWFGRLLEVLRAVRQPKYHDQTLRGVLASMVGEEARLGELCRPVLIPTVALASGRARLFRSSAPADAGLKVIDVALAASAVPGFFPLVEIEGQGYIDGGIFSTTPDLLALHEAVYRLGAAEKETTMLSIGTVSGAYTTPPGAGRSRQGLLYWMMRQRLVRILMAAQQSNIEGLLIDRLGERYFRIDRQPDEAQQNAIGLDIATPEARKILTALAAASVDQAAADPRLAALLHGS